MDKNSGVNDQPVAIPPPETPRESPFLDRRRPRSNPVLVVFLVLVLTGFGVAAGYAVGYFAALSTQEKSTDITATPAPAPKPKHLVLLEELSRQISAGDIHDIGGVPEQRPDGYKYSVALTDTAPGLSLTKPAPEAKTTLASIETYFETKNYNKKLHDTNASAITAVTDYTSSDVKCRLSAVYKTLNDTTNPVKLTLGCLDTPGYQQLADGAKSYYEAYLRSRGTNSTVAEPIFVGQADVADSKTRGYKLAKYQMSLSTEVADSQIGHFYHGTDKTWKYFAISEGLVSCTDYSTDELKKAYLDQPCLDTVTGRQTTVKL